MEEEKKGQLIITLIFLLPINFDNIVLGII